MTSIARPPSRSRGFTLVEMMTSIVVLAIILAFALPNLSSFVRTSRVRGAQSELIASFMLARSEATKRGLAVTVGALAPTTGNEFSAGWTVWLDTNGNGTVESGELVIRTYPSVSSGVVISTGSQTAVTFAPTGFVTPIATTNFKVCPSMGDTNKGFTVALQPVGLADVTDQIACP